MGNGSFMDTLKILDIISAVKQANYDISFYDGSSYKWYTDYLCEIPR